MDIQTVRFVKIKKKIINENILVIFILVIRINWNSNDIKYIKNN